MCLAKDKDQARIVFRLLTRATRIANPRVGATPDPFFSRRHGPGQGRDAVS